MPTENVNPFGQPLTVAEHHPDHAQPDTGPECPVCKKSWTHVFADHVQCHNCGNKFAIPAGVAPMSKE